MPRKYLLGSIIGISLIHLVTLQVNSTPLHWVFKLAPMLLIIVLAATARGKDHRSAYRKIIVIGLILGLCGDACLLMPGDGWFTAGLASFLAGHLLYAAAMLPRLKRSVPLALTVVPIAIYAFVMAGKLHGSLMADSSQSGLWPPVLAYVLVLSAMCWLAVMTGNGYAAAGSALFVASDSMLSWNKFVSPFEAAGVCVMATYFAAQLLIACSISLDPGKAETAPRDLAG